MAKRKFYLNKVTIEVLTEDSPLEIENLNELHYEISEGDSVGGGIVINSTLVGAKRCATKLYAFGSEPGFFQLDDNGKDVDDGM